MSSALRKAVADYEIAISELTTALSSAKDKVAQLRGPDGCRCKSCLENLDHLEGRFIPSTNGSIAAIRGAIATLRWQIQEGE